jgi:hypothetical protein
LAAGILLACNTLRTNLPLPLFSQQEPSQAAVKR